MRSPHDRQMLDDLNSLLDNELRNYAIALTKRSFLGEDDEEHIEATKEMQDAKNRIRTISVSIDKFIRATL